MLFLAFLGEHLTFDCTKRVGRVNLFWGSKKWRKRTNVNFYLRFFCPGSTVKWFGKLKEKTGKFEITIDII